MAIQKSVRVMFLVMNGIFCAAGLAAVSVGSYFQASPLMRRNAVVSEENIISLISIGVIVLFTSCIGFYGYVDPVRRKPIVISFSFSVIGVAMVQVVMGILIWYKTLTMYDDFAIQWRQWEFPIREGFQRLNQNAPCCGYADPRDYPALDDICTINTPLTVPGCRDVVYAYASSYLTNIYTCVFIFVFIGIFDFFTAVMLVQAANEEERYDKMSQKVITRPNELKMQYM